MTKHGAEGPLHLGPGKHLYLSGVSAGDYLVEREALKAIERERKAGDAEPVG